MKGLLYLHRKEMKPLDKTSSRPLYLQLDDILRSSIQNGTWKENQMIPSENELANTYGISRVTVRLVVKGLVGEGLLYRVQGKGTFVSKPKVMTISPSWGCVSRQFETQGLQVKTQLLEFTIKKPSLLVAEALRISLDDDIRYICRLRYIDGTPVSIHKSCIPFKLCSSLTESDLQGNSLGEVIEQKLNFVPGKIHETLEITHATDFEAECLGINTGDKVVLIESINELSSGPCFQFSKTVFRSDNVKLRFEYRSKE